MKTLLVVLAAAISAAPALAQTIPLVREGKSDYAIVVPPDASPALRHGAEDLRAHLENISGADLPIRAVPLAEAPEHAIVVRTDPKLAEEEIAIRTEPPRVYLSGGGKRGAMYACYAFLEDALGCRWFNSRVSRIPKQPTITLSALDLHEKPGFEYREPYYTEALDTDWAARNRTNGHFQHLDASVGGRLVYYPFVHTFSQIIPPQEYFAAHPEYFSEVNGKRVPDRQLCLTNPEVLRLTIARVEDWIAQHPEATIFSVSQNDTDGYCTCPACRKVIEEEGAPSGALIRFVNAVGDAVAKDHPNVLIDTLAYQWSEKPPLHVKPHTNVRVRIAPIYACFGHGLDQCAANTSALANLKAWAKITDQLYVWHYSTNFANYLQPLPDLDEVARDIPLFRDSGVVGLFYEGDYAPGGGGEMSELKAYLMAKLMWDPDRPAKPIIDEYVRGVYGPAAPYIRRWLDVLHAPVREDAAMEVHIYDPPTAKYLSDATLSTGDALFDEAERAAANDPTALDEVKRARLALEYVELMRAAPGSPERAALSRTVSDKVRAYGIGEVREGQPAAQFLASIGG